MRLAPLLSANSSCDALSIDAVSAVVKISGVVGEVRLSATEAKITQGTFDSLISGKAPMLAFEQPPPWMMNTLSPKISFLAAPMAAAGSQRSSCRTISILRPLIPPALFTSL